MNIDVKGITGEIDILQIRVRDSEPVALLPPISLRADSTGSTVDVRDVCE